MKYRVELTRAARHDIGEIYAWLYENAPAFADRWLVGIHQAIATLAEMPQRCRIVPEAEDDEGEPRQLLFHAWRVIFEISGRTVMVHHVRHSSMPER